MKKAASKLRMVIFWTCLLIAILIVVFLTVICNDWMEQGAPQADESFNLYEYFSSELISSELVYLLLCFAILIPVSLILLIIAVIPLARPLYNRRKLQKMAKKAQRKLAKQAKKAARVAKKENKKAKKLNKTRFPQLRSIDEVQKKRKAVQYDSATLEEICLRFQTFAAGKLGLYYEIEDIRRFIAGMGMSKLIILRGISGTGKTSLAYAAGEFFGNSSTIIPIQPMWKERSDMIGYFNEFTKKFNETTMLAKLYEAGGRGDLYFTVLDEVNISRIEYYFAEFLSLLEIPDASKRYLDVVADSWASDPRRIVNGKLLLPENMWFIGTANNDDSTFAISDKVYDRAAVLDLDRKCAPFQADATGICHISYAELTRLFEEAKRTYALSDESREKLAKLDTYLSEVFRVSFGNRIMKQIETYIPITLACGGSEEGALDDLLSRKILRKLEQLSTAYVKNESGDLLNLLDDLFGRNSLPQCRAYIEKLQKGY